jgi:hypothetical protein
VWAAATTPRSSPGLRNAELLGVENAAIDAVTARQEHHLEQLPHGQDSGNLLQHDGLVRRAALSGIDHPTQRFQDQTCAFVLQLGQLLRDIRAAGHCHDEVEHLLEKAAPFALSGDCVGLARRAAGKDAGFRVVDRLGMANIALLREQARALAGRTRIAVHLDPGDGNSEPVRRDVETSRTGKQVHHLDLRRCRRRRLSVGHGPEVYKPGMTSPEESRTRHAGKYFTPRSCRRDVFVTTRSNKGGRPCDDRSRSALRCEEHHPCQGSLFEHS